MAASAARAQAQRELAEALRSRPTDSERLADAQDRLRVAASDAESAVSASGATRCAPRTELAPTPGTSPGG